MRRSIPAIIAWTSLAIASLSAQSPARAAIITELYGIGFGGSFYRISEATGAATSAGSTGISLAGGLEFGPGGILYAISGSSGARGLYRVNPATATATFIAALDGSNSYTEGGLAISPAGAAYITNTHFGGSRYLGRLDLATGAVTRIGVLGGQPDINGLAWRSDGMLVGLVSNGNSLVVINPATAAISTLASLPFAVGTIGGMTALGDVAYFATAGTSSSGTNSLYTFDMFTGQVALIGSLGPATGSGISGLAIRQIVTPEPASLALAGAGAICLLIYSSKKRKPREAPAPGARP